MFLLIVINIGCSGRIEPKTTTPAHSSESEPWNYARPDELLRARNLQALRRMSPPWWKSSGAESQKHRRHFVAADGAASTLKKVVVPYGHRHGAARALPARPPASKATEPCESGVEDVMIRWTISEPAGGGTLSKVPALISDSMPPSSFIL